MKKLIENTLSKEERKELIDYILQDINIFNSNIKNIKKEISIEKKVINELNKNKVNRKLLLKNKDYFLTYLYNTKNQSELDKKIIQFLGLKIRKFKKPECFFCGKQIYYKRGKSFVLLRNGKDYLFCSKKCLGNWALNIKTKNKNMFG